MRELKLIDLARVTNALLKNVEAHQGIGSICIDSKKAKPGDLFIAIEGERFDGHDFAKEAFNKGCSALLLHKDIPDGDKMPILRVENTLEAFHNMAKYYISLFDIPIVAVTGSTGKTSTKEMIANVLSQKYNVIKNIGNYNNHIGLPLSVFNIEDHHEVAVFEMGMNHLGEIDLLASIIKPDIGVITNIGLSHIENLGTQENILKAKLELTHYFGCHNKLIINYDDKYLKTIHTTQFETIKIGKDKYSDYIISNIYNFGEKGIQYDLKANHQVYSVSLNVLGEHNLYNASLAIAVGKALNVEIKKAINGLKLYEGYNMRLNIQYAPQNIKILNDVYNASPDSMKAALDTLMSIEGKRHIAILSNMLEMGGCAKEYHYEIGEYAVKNGVDMIIAVGNEAENIALGAKGIGENQKIYHFMNNDKLLEKIDHLLNQEDIILVKGSRGMKMETIVNHILER